KVQTSTVGFQILAKPQHQSLLSLVHGIYGIEDQEKHQHHRNDGENAAISGSRRAATAGRAFASKQPVQLVHPFLNCFIQVWRSVFTSPVTTSPGILVVSVSTRFVP